MKKSDLSNVIKRNFSAINSPDVGSKSKPHRSLSKIYVQARVKNKNYKEYGILKSIDSEVEYLNMDCGNPFEIVLPDNSIYTGIPENGNLRIDCFELCRDDVSTFTRNVEVLVNHPYNIYFPRTKKGLEWAYEFGNHMLRKGYFNHDIKKRFSNNIRRYLKIDSSHKLSRIHYHFSDDIPVHLEPDYGKFRGMVGNSKKGGGESELERKWRLYSGIADELVFVFFHEDLGLYVRDLSRLLKKHKINVKESSISHFVTIKKTDLNKIYRGCAKEFFSKTKKRKSGECIIYDAESTIHIPKSLKGKALMEVWDLEDLV